MFFTWPSLQSVMNRTNHSQTLNFQKDVNNLKIFGVAATFITVSCAMGFLVGYLLFAELATASMFGIAAGAMSLLVICAIYDSIEKDNFSLVHKNIKLNNLYNKRNRPIHPINTKNDNTKYVKRQTANIFRNFPNFDKNIYCGDDFTYIFRENYSSIQLESENMLDRWDTLDDAELESFIQDREYFHNIFCLRMAVDFISYLEIKYPKASALYFWETDKNKKIFDKLKNDSKDYVKFMDQQKDVHKSERALYKDSAILESDLIKASKFKSYRFMFKDRGELPIIVAKAIYYYMLDHDCSPILNNKLFDRNLRIQYYKHIKSKQDKVDQDMAKLEKNTHLNEYTDIKDIDYYKSLRNSGMLSKSFKKKTSKKRSKKH